MKSKISTAAAIYLCAILVLGISAGFYLYKQKTARYIPSRALEAMPRRARDHYTRGNEHSYKKETDKAISEYGKSIEIKPTAEAYCGLAVSYMEKGDYKTAIINLKASIKLNPKYPKSEYAIAVCYTHLRPRQVKLAREHLEKAKKLGYQVPEWFKRHLLKLEEQKE